MIPEKKYHTIEPVNLAPGESKAARFAEADGTEYVFMVSISQAGVVTVITDDGSITTDPDLWLKGDWS